jgi:hypothetical protein
MILMTCLWAYKRGEWNAVWNGTFYDLFLMDPFTFASRSPSLMRYHLPNHHSERKTYENDVPKLKDLIENNPTADEFNSKYTLHKKLFEG